MLHRLKLRLIYGEILDADRAAVRRKFKVILFSGLAVYLPFLAIGYFLFLELRVSFLITMALLSALTCVPVALYAYARGFGQPLMALLKKRPDEMCWLAIKIGFVYAFWLYWMVLGMVEFLFGYHVVRAAMISFVASAVARDGFDIGYLRAREDAGAPVGPIRPSMRRSPRTIFPDGRAFSEVFQVAARSRFFLIGGAIVSGAAIGWAMGAYFIHPIAQSLWVGFVGGLISILAFSSTCDVSPNGRAWVRFFLWPGFTMACTYFFILGYLLRFVFQIPLPVSLDRALLMAACCGLCSCDAVFIGHLKNSFPPTTV